MFEELISCKKPDHHKKIMISYVRGVNLHINLMISTTNIDKDLQINL